MEGKEQHCLWLSRMPMLNEFVFIVGSTVTIIVDGKKDLNDLPHYGASEDFDTSAMIAGKKWSVIVMEPNTR